MRLLKNLRPTLIVLNDDCRLMPGVNQISEEQYKNNTEYIKTFVRCKYVEEINAPKPGKTTKATPSRAKTKEVEGLSDYSATKAVGIIKETVNDSLLLKWQETETRKQVLNAIGTQLKRNAEAIQKGKGSKKLKEIEGADSTEDED